MRTTLDIEDDVLAAARSLSASSGVSLGTAVSVLARRGLAHRVVDSDVPHFDVSPDTPPMTPEMVKEAMEE